MIDLIIMYTPLHVLVYELTDEIAVFKPTMPIILVPDYLYLIVATAISIYKRSKAITRPEKKKYGSQIIFILFFTISGLLIAFLMNLPAIELCIIPVVLKLFVELQDSQINTDALTKLYNRRRMTEFITEEIATCSEENPLNIIMVDLDYFKSITDILGHDTGDKALICFSKALRDIVMARDAVAARWGGDEFVVAGKDKELPEKFTELLSAELNNNTDLPFVPRFSSGLYSCTSSGMPCDEAMVQADSALYKDKEEHHKIQNDFINKLNAIKKKPL